MRCSIRILRPLRARSFVGIVGRSGRGVRPEGCRGTRSRRSQPGQRGGGLGVGASGSCLLERQAGGQPPHVEPVFIVPISPRVLLQPSLTRIVLVASGYPRIHIGLRYLRSSIRAFTGALRSFAGGSTFTLGTLKFLTFYMPHVEARAVVRCAYFSDDR